MAWAKPATLLVNLYRRNARRKPTLWVRSPLKMGGGRPRKAPFAAAAGAAICTGRGGAGAMNAGAGATAAAMMTGEV